VLGARTQAAPAYQAAPYYLLVGLLVGIVSVYGQGILVSKLNTDTQVTSPSCVQANETFILVERVFGLGQVIRRCTNVIVYIIFFAGRAVKANTSGYIIILDSSVRKSFSAWVGWFKRASV